jgi:hypothetical protein
MKPARGCGSRSPGFAPAALLFCSLLVSSGCEEQADSKLIIHNQGTQTAVLSVEYDGGSGVFFKEDLLEPGTTFIRSYPDLVRLDVLITRRSDGLMLVRDVYTSADLHGDDEELVLAIRP